MALPLRALFDGAGRQLAGAPAPMFARARGAHVMQEQDGRRWLVAPVLAPRAHLMLFGAGHVGAAIVRAMAYLPCNVTWVDERDDMFPESVPDNVRVEATDTPEAWSPAPAGASFLVMTHSHALDQRLTEAILRAPRCRLVRPDRLEDQAQAVRAPAARARPGAERIGRWPARSACPASPARSRQ